jgi:hypothetical protein
LVTATGKTVYEKDLYTSEIFDDAALLKINEWLGKNGYSNIIDVFSSDVAKAVSEIGVTDEESKGRSSKKE